MLVRPLSASLFACFLVAGCGGSSTSTPDTTGTDTLLADTAVADTAENDTAVADTAVADTATVADTAVADTTTPADTTQVDDAAKTCPGILQCLSDNCLGLAIGPQQACVSACLAKGDADEQQAVLNIQTCAQTKHCIPPDDSDTSLRDSYDCQRQCVQQAAVCFAGTFGAGTCQALSGCVENCDDSDIMCQRLCYAAASQVEVENYLDYNFCGLSQCYNTADPIAQETCLQQVIHQPACSDPYAQCFGTTGAGPGAGAGGAAE